MPAIAAFAIFQFLWTWNDYLIAVVMLNGGTLRFPDHTANRQPRRRLRRVRASADRRCLCAGVCAARGVLQPPALLRARPPGRLGQGLIDPNRRLAVVSSALVSSIDPSGTIGYLGPRGTFTEQALCSQADLATLNLRPHGSIVEVLRAAERGDVTYGFAAIENMIEGSVNATLDTLAFDAAELLIQREVVMNISLNLLVHPGVALSDIAHVRSYPVAYAQCRRYLTDQLGHAAIEATNSTADAARELAESERRDTAAIAPKRAGEVYGLEVLATDIEDHPENQTRFVLVGRDGVTAPSGHDKTSILIYQREDAPGSLVGILQEFAARSINLTRLESRPTRRGWATTAS